MTVVILNKSIEGTSNFNTKVLELDSTLDWEVGKIINYDNFYYEVRSVEGNTIKATDGFVDQSTLEELYNE